MGEDDRATQATRKPFELLLLFKEPCFIYYSFPLLQDEKDFFSSKERKEGWTDAPQKSLLKVIESSALMFEHCILFGRHNIQNS